MAKSSASHLKRLSCSKLFFCIRFLTQGLEHSAQDCQTLFKTFSIPLASCECSAGARKVVGLDSRNWDRNWILGVWSISSILIPDSELKDLFSPFQKHCSYTHVPFAVSGASSKAYIRQFRECRNPAFQEDDVLSSCYLYHLSGFFPCSGTGETLEFPLRKSLDQF